jgi:hypothetical protein
MPKNRRARCIEPRTAETYEIALTLSALVTAQVPDAGTLVTHEIAKATAGTRFW